MRWGKDGSGYGTNSYFASAIKHYGWNNFSHEILYDNLTKEEACEKEIALIESYHTNKHDFGYNSTTGGDIFTMTPEVKEKMSKSMMGNKNGCHPCAEETKLKISAAQKGRPFTEEHKRNLSIAAKNRNSPPCSYEKRLKISQAHSKKPVICLETGEIYESVHGCAKQLNLCATNLVKCLKGKIKSTGGLHFKYYNSTINA